MASPADWDPCFEADFGMQCIVSFSMFSPGRQQLEAFLFSGPSGKINIWEILKAL